MAVHTRGILEPSSEVLKGFIITCASLRIYTAVYQSNSVLPIHYYDLKHHFVYHMYACLGEADGTGDGQSNPKWLDPRCIYHFGLVSVWSLTAVYGMAL